MDSPIPDVSLLQFRVYDVSTTPPRHAKFLAPETCDIPDITTGKLIPYTALSFSLFKNLISDASRDDRPFDITIYHPRLKFRMPVRCDSDPRECALSAYNENHPQLQVYVTVTPEEDPSLLYRDLGRIYSQEFCTVQ